MAYVNVDTSADNYGNAPKGSQIGDTVHTAGGDYTIVSPNSAGSSYNPKSGLWSIKTDSNIVPNSGMDEARDTGADQTNNNNDLMNQAALLANQISAFSSAQQYKYNSEEAQKTRDWQERMSNTSHQREVLDLLLAGLNPVLSAQLGGASTPAGATAQGSSYTGQKADVDTSFLPYMSSIIGSFLGYDSQMNIAQMQMETALQTAKISSAASMYNADKVSDASMFSALTGANASRYASDLNYKSSSWQNKAFEYGLGFMQDFLKQNGYSGNGNPLSDFKDYLNKQVKGATGGGSLPTPFLKKLLEAFKNPNTQRDGPHGF